MGKWSMDLTKYAKKAGVEINEVRKAYAFALYSSIVKKTPVDTGRARGNWNISVGKEDTSVDDPSSYPKPSGKYKDKSSPPRAKLKYTDPNSIPEPKGDESIFISNNLPYIASLEYGSSKQAPNGMVGVTLANNENIFNAAVRAVKGSE